jgi:hypothetical protein
MVEAEGQKVTRGNRAPLKDVKNEGRSGNVYENKGPDDNMPDTKDDICAWLHAILHKKTRILPKPSVFLPLFGRWGASFSLQNVESPSAALGSGATTETSQMAHRLTTTTTDLIS